MLGFVQTHRFERLAVVAVHDRRQQCIRHACGVQDPPRISDQTHGRQFEQCRDGEVQCFVVMVIPGEFEFQEPLAAGAAVECEVMGLKVVPVVVLCQLAFTWVRNNLEDVRHR